MEASAKPAPKKRQWWSISLRGTLLLVLVVGGLMGTWARRAQLQRAEVAMVESAHGAVVYDHETFGPYWKVSTAAQLRTQEETRRTGGLVLVGELEPDFFGPSNMAYNPLVAWTERVLGVDYAHDVVAVWYIHSGRVRDADLARLSAFPKMEKLVLSRTSTGDDGLARVAKFRNLRSLQLDWTQVTDAGMSHIRRLDRLEDLSIAQEGGGVTDAGVARLSGLKQLRSLEIGGPRITDASLRSLWGLANLEYLLVTQAPNVTHEAVVELRRVLPRLEIIEQ